ncbi:alpha/beta fold hydrolase [Agromyces archimandritae]|uniref:Alpha/beta fold hydrolase n=2 Tax=Agromyces archimandritae TaxID=2781962 RepID=A0A975IQ13_9MICO|nr:alpha/beta fold hydrolase [Agromyces archimandritae]
MWCADGGDGEVLLMLHPGGTDARALGPLRAELIEDYRIVTPEQRGHGHTPDRDGEWHFADMAADTAALLDGMEVGRAHVFGWSAGAIVGLHLALSRPELVASLVFGGAPFHVEGWRAGVLDGEPPAFMADAYAEVSPDGAAHWPTVTAKSNRMHENEPRLSEDDLGTLAMPVLVVLGDDDEVRFDHAIRMYETLPDGELAIVPRATHGLIVEKADLLARLIRDFHARGDDNGVAPIRRRP